MRRRELLGLGAAAVVAGGWLHPARAADGEADLFDALGYRRARYRAPVDRDPAPAQTVALDRALALRPARNALFIDVLPAEDARRDPATGAWRGLRAHDSIPGALWFPETGRAAPDPVLWAGLVSAVQHTRARHPGWPVVLFCRADCWMSWNAARRLALGGVQQVLWLAEGIDGWHDRGRALVPATAQAIPG